MDQFIEKYSDYIEDNDLYIYSEDGSRSKASNMSSLASIEPKKCHSPSPTF